MDINDTNWYKTSIENTYDILKTNKNGLEDEKIDQRLKRYGLNKLPPPKEKHPILKFLSHYNNILIYVLIGAALITAYLGHWIDTYIIIGVVFLNGLIGYIQEGKAEKAIDTVKNMLSINATVKREGKLKEILAEELVIGDIVHLKSGDKVPADLRLISTNNLKIDEASLTGESEPVAKSTHTLQKDLSLGDRTNMAYSSTIVTSGEGVGITVATGENTEIGKINKMISEVEHIKTPLIKQVDQFGKRLTIFILSLGLLILLIGYIFRGIQINELFLSVVGIAVAAIPEGLPAIITITLAIGVKRMAERHAIIRKLPAVETLGSVSIICSDKTGTLTEGEMTVKEVVTQKNTYEITGNGYEPDGEFLLNNKKIEIKSDSVLDILLENAFLCNDARLINKNDKWKVEGSPTEGALKTLAHKGGLNDNILKQKVERIDVIPFNSNNKFMATLNKYADQSIIYLKGAPEAILNKCSKVYSKEGLKNIDNDYWNKKQGELANKGYRILAFAYKDIVNDKTEFNANDVKKDMIFLGIVGVVDPPRKEAIEAVKECNEAGINVKMITGDHAETAAAIAKQIGLSNICKTISGNELDLLDDDKLKKVIKDIDVFARVSPRHKLRLVTALQKLGYITAMTGDGVNDAPALKKADIGIAMGIKGTEAAKEAAEMVLADDNFASITNAVEEGRTVYDNLKKSLLFMLPTNGGEALIIMAAVLFGFTLPITPVQILWVNMITAVTLALTLAFEPMEEEVMKRQPRDTDESLTPLTLLFRIGYVSVLLTIATLGIYYWAITNGLTLQIARNLAVNMLVYGEIFYLFNSRHMINSSLNLKNFTATPYVWKAVLTVISLQFIFVYVPFFQNIFDIQPFHYIYWLIIILINLMIFILVELEKFISRKYFN